ncbi:MAG TPA: ABC transporter permease [bacterium]|nr:ABC transporter permease [bacterium]
MANAPARQRSGAGFARLLLFPPAVWMTLFFALPLGLVFLYSIGDSNTYGGVTFGCTLKNYRAIWDPFFLNIFLRSLLYSTGITVLSLLLAMPLAYVMACAPARWQKVMMFLIIIPFWTNFLVRMFAFIVLLGDNGLVNTLLTRLGVIGEPLPMMNSLFAVIVGFVYWNLPYMVLPLYAALERMEVAHVEAAMDLGAGRFTAFRTITLPASVPGIIAGVIFCFIPTLGCFVIPDILGGPDNLMIGNIITLQFLQARNWPLGSAFATIFITLVMVMISLGIRYYTPANEKARGSVL